MLTRLNKVNSDISRIHSNANECGHHNSGKKKNAAHRGLKRSIENRETNSCSQWAVYRSQLGRVDEWREKRVNYRPSKVIERRSCNLSHLLYVV